MSIHNQERMATDRYGWPRMTRMSVALIATALVVVFAGFGCDPQRTPPVRDLPAVGADGTITSWTSYTSPTLGITIPYPEGWVVEEDGSATEFFSVVPPADSDLAPKFWIESQTGSVASLLAKLDNIVSDELVVRSGIQMRKITRRDDLSDFDGLAVFYLWEDDGNILRIGGRENDPVMEYSVDHVEVSP